MFKSLNFYSFCCLLTCTALSVTHLQSSHENWRSSQDKAAQRLTPHQASSSPVLGQRDRDDDDTLATSSASVSSANPVEEQVERLNTAPFDIQGLLSADVLVHYVYPFAYEVLGMDAPKENVRQLYTAHYSQFLKEDLSGLTPLDWNNHITAEIKSFSRSLRENAIDYTVLPSQSRTYLSSVLLDKRELQERINQLKEDEWIRGIGDKECEDLLILFALEREDMDGRYQEYFKHLKQEYPDVQTRKKVIRLFLTLSSREQDQLIGSEAIEGDNLANVRRDLELIESNRVLDVFEHSLENNQVAEAERLVILLDHDEINAVNRNGLTPLARVVNLGNLKLARLLVELGADVDAANGAYDHTALMSAVYRGNLDMIRLLVELGADINAVDRFEETPLIYAARHKGHLDVIRLLVEKGADVNKEGLTALMRAAEEGHLDVVRLLVELRADIHAADYEKQTALMFAAEKGHLDVVRFLEELGADVNARNHYRRQTALMLAAEKGHLDVVRFLKERKADINARDRYSRWTALMRAAVEGSLDVVRLLVELGADIHAADYEGQTASMLAARMGRLDVVRFLKECSANDDVVDGEEETPEIIDW